MAQNITLLGASYSDVPAVTLPKTGGGTAKFTDVSNATAIQSTVLSSATFYDASGTLRTGTLTMPQGFTVTTTQDAAGGDIVTITGEQIQPLTWGTIRPDAERIATYRKDSLVVTDDSATIPSWSTSAAQTVLASEAMTPTISLTYADYNYYVLLRTLTIPIYNTTSKAKGRVEYSCSSHLYEIVDVGANNFPTLVDPTKIYTSRVVLVSSSAAIRELYWSSASAIAMYTATTYGVAQVGVAPSISSGVMTINTPTVQMRGSTTYFTQTYWNAITDIRRQFVIEVYRAPKTGLAPTGWGGSQQMLRIAQDIQNETHTLS